MRCDPRLGRAFGILGLMLIAMVVLLVDAARGQSAGARKPANPSSPAPPTFKTESTWEARAASVRAIERAQADYRQQVLKAKQKYRDALQQAKAAAMKSGNLDEANAVQAELAQVEKDIRGIPDLSTPQMAPPPELIIRRASYGVEGRATDIAQLMNTQIRNGRIDSVNPPDPASGVVKSVKIEGTYGGYDFVLSFPENFPLHHLVFGRPSPPPQLGPPSGN